MLQLEIYSKVFALQLTLQFFQQYLSKTMFKKFAVLCAAMMFSSSVAAAYELPPVPDSMSDTEIAEFIQSLESLKPTPAPTIDIDMYVPWTEENINTFSQMLYDAAKSDGNWDDNISDDGLHVLTNCITNYYSEKISYRKALIYYDTMSPMARQEFEIVLQRCLQFALENENTFI